MRTADGFLVYTSRERWVVTVGKDFGEDDVLRACLAAREQGPGGFEEVRCRQAANCKNWERDTELNLLQGLRRLPRWHEVG